MKKTNLVKNCTFTKCGALIFLSLEKEKNVK